MVLSCSSASTVNLFTRLRKEASSKGPASFILILSSPNPSVDEKRSGESYSIKEKMESFASDSHLSGRIPNCNVPQAAIIRAIMAGTEYVK
jgi:hypothetical protein